MSAGASARLALLVLLVRTHLVCSKQVLCSRDGLIADYETQCREYMRCFEGRVTGRYSCPSGREFNEWSAACEPRRRQPCERRACDPLEARSYATPGTACRRYYHCANGTARDLACPPGAWFDATRQACTLGAGTCYEPVCAGLPDGDHADASHECRRTLRCRAAEIQAVLSTPPLADCPPPRSAAVALPAGDADFCADDTCSSLCHAAADGAYADRSTNCREYFMCESGRVTSRGVCAPGMTFAGGTCLNSDIFVCPPPARSPCFNRVDGLHRDWTSCGSWLECRRERVSARGSCGAGLVFDGVSCVAAESFYCDGPAPARACEGRPTGLYRDVVSNCTRYYRCEGGLRTVLECGAGLAFDGARCVVAGSAACARDGCGAEGRRRSAGAGCRGYSWCAGGERALYACAPGHVFDGETCVRRRPGLCPDDDYSCVGLADGYHPEIESNCRRYFYCEGGDRLATMSCFGSKVFDGRACVEPSQYECGGLPQNMIENGGKYCEKDGFFLQPGSECRDYYFCVSGLRTQLSCDAEQAFNGQVCVPRTQYSCPG